MVNLISPPVAFSAFLPLCYHADMTGEALFKVIISREHSCITRNNNSCQMVGYDKAFFLYSNVNLPYLAICSGQRWPKGCWFSRLDWLY